MYFLRLSVLKNPHVTVAVNMLKRILRACSIRLAFPLFRTEREELILACPCPELVGITPASESGIYSARLCSPLANAPLYNVAFDSYDRVTRFSTPIVNDRPVSPLSDELSPARAKHSHAHARASACVSACVRARQRTHGGSEQIFKIIVPDSGYCATREQLAGSSAN